MTTKKVRIKEGDRVKMSEELKSQLRVNGSGAHVEEFGLCEGVVLGEVEWAVGVTGPEVDVRWEPDGLRYAYDPDLLIIA